MRLGDTPDTKGGVLTLLPNDTRPVVRRGLRGMPYSKDWIAYMNAWADQKPLKPTDGPVVFKSTMEYSETGITGDVKEITCTFDTSGTVLDLPDTATKTFIDIGLTNGVLPESDSISSNLAVPDPAPTRYCRLNNTSVLCTRLLLLGHSLGMKLLNPTTLHFAR